MALETANVDIETDSKHLRLVVYRNDDVNPDERKSFYLSHIACGGSCSLVPGVGISLCVRIDLVNYGVLTPVEQPQFSK